MEKVKLEKEKIVATLTYGKVYPKGVFTFMYIVLALVVLSIPLFIYVAIDSSQYEILYCFIFFGIIIFCFTYILCVCTKTNNKIKQWKKDAVKLWADTKELDSIKNTFFGVRKIKIKVMFSYNGKKIEQVSGELNDIRENVFYTHKGYDAIYQKFANRKIEILYSPSFNQNMIIKPQKNSI